MARTCGSGPDGFAAVNAVQAQYKLTPLSAWGKPYTPSAEVPVDSEVDTKRTPVDQVAAMDAGVFFRTLARVMNENPSAAEDGRALERLKKLGVEPGKEFNISAIDPAIARGLERAVKDVQIKMQEGVTKMKTVNGWIQPSDLGRYGTDYDTRAGIAYVGLGADMPEDTIYPTAFVDGDGKLLDSANKYVMHYDKGQLPPTNGTWSVSQYQGNFYVPNVLNRYAIAPWMPLKFNEDGSLDIYLQAESPGADKEANWLPTPLGAFNITIATTGPRKRPWTGRTKIRRSKRSNEKLTCSRRSWRGGCRPRPAGVSADCGQALVWSRDFRCRSCDEPHRRHEPHRAGLCLLAG